MRALLFLCSLWAHLPVAQPEVDYKMFLDSESPTSLPDPEISLTLLPTIHAFQTMCYGRGFSSANPMSTASLAHRIGPVCEAVMATPVCRAVEEEKKLKCDDIGEAPQMNAWAFLKGCGGGGPRLGEGYPPLSLGGDEMGLGQRKGRRDTGRNKRVHGHGQALSPHGVREGLGSITPMDAGDGQEGPGHDLCPGKYWDTSPAPPKRPLVPGDL